MRTLSEITSAIRLGQEVSTQEMRLAIVAYDVLVHTMDLPNDVAKLQHYFTAAATPVGVYVGEANDPDCPAAQEWYASMFKVVDDVKNGRGEAGTDSAPLS